MLEPRFKIPADQYSGVARVSGTQGNAENWRPPEADIKKKHLMIPCI